MESEAAVAVIEDTTVENLMDRLTAIRERIWRLQALFAVTLSQECAVDADRYLKLFQTLAEQLKEKDSAAFERLVSGHESLLLSPPVNVKATIPEETQRWCEIKWEISQAPRRHTPKRDVGSVPDGLGWML